jgi:hypothetical protein
MAKFACPGYCTLGDLHPFRPWIIFREIQVRDPQKFCDSFAGQALGSYLLSDSIFAGPANPEKYLFSPQIYVIDIREALDSVH